MKLTLGGGRVVVACPTKSCGEQVDVGPPAHKVTVGLSTGITVSPAVVCPFCSMTFDVRRGQVRPLGGYGLPPRHVAYTPQTRPAADDAVVVSRRGSDTSGAGEGDAGHHAEDEPEPVPQADPYPHRKPMGEEAPLVEEAPGDPDTLLTSDPDAPPSDVPNDEYTYWHPTSYTKDELVRACEQKELPTSGTKAELCKRLNGFYAGEEATESGGEEE